MTIQACIFDMDGVLIDTEPVWRRVEHDVFARIGVELTDEQLRETWGLRIEDLVDHWYRYRPWDGVRPRAVQREIVRAMVAHVHAEGHALPGALDAITVARAAGCKVGIASSSSREMIEAVVESLGIGGQVDALCTADDEERGKPDPGVYLSAARVLGVAPVDCIAVEDSPWGVRAVKAAGMTCVGVRTEAVDPATIAEADVVIESLVDFTPELLSSLQPADVSLEGRSGRSADRDRSGE